MTRSTIVEAAVDVADVRMGLTWVMVVEYMTIMARSMDELERRERDLERRERELERDERELEKRERLHEREDEMYRRGWFGERGIRDEYEGTEPYMRRGRRSRYY